MKQTKEDIARILYEEDWRRTYDPKPWKKLVDGLKRHKYMPQASHWIRVDERVKRIQAWEKKMARFFGAEEGI